MEKLKEKVLQGAGQNSEALFLKMRERENRNMNIIVHNIKESNSRNKEYRIQNDRELLSNMTMFVKKNLVYQVKFSLNSKHKVEFISIQPGDEESKPGHKKKPFFY